MKLQRTSLCGLPANGLLALVLTVTGLVFGSFGCNQDGPSAEKTVHDRSNVANPVATTAAAGNPGVAPASTPAAAPETEIVPVATRAAEVAPSTATPAAEHAAEPLALSGAIVPPSERLDELNEPDMHVLLEGKYEVPVVSAGRVPGPTRLTEAPGYRPPDDAESDAVLRGYRLTPPNAARLSGGAESAEWLARDVLMALTLNDRQALLDLRIDFAEFSQILWPEMPQSRPITNIKAEDSWFFLSRACVSAVDDALAQWGGQRMEFQRLSFTEGLTRYPNYRLYQGVVIHALLANREEVAIPVAHTLVEKDGVWKIYIYKD